MFSHCHIVNYVMMLQVTKSQSCKVNKMICNILQVVMFLTTQLTKLNKEIKFKNECECVC